MMTKGVTQAVIQSFIEVLKIQREETDRMDTLEKFDQIFGMSIPNWEQTFIEELRKCDNTEAAVESVEAFISKNHVYDDNGNLRYERI